MSITDPYEAARIKTDPYASARKNQPIERPESVLQRVVRQGAKTVGGMAPAFMPHLSPITANPRAQAPVGEGMVGFADQVAGALPSGALRLATGQKVLDTTAAQTGRMAANVAAPVAFGAMAAKAPAIAGPGIAKRAMQGGLAGGLSGFHTAPEDPLDVGARVGQGAAGGGIGGALGGVFGTAEKYVPGIWKNISQGRGRFEYGKRLRAAAGQETRTEEIAARRGGLLRTKLLEKSTAAKEAGLAETETALKRRIGSSAHQEAIDLERSVPSFFGSKSREFGEKLSGLMPDELHVDAKEVIEPIQNALIKNRILVSQPDGTLIVTRAPKTGMESKAFGIWKGLIKEQRTQEPPPLVNTAEGMVREEAKPVTVNISELMKYESGAKQAVPFGRGRTPKDAFALDLQRELSGLVEGKVPGVRELRASHQPYMKVKKATIRKTRPFGDEFATETPARFIERASKGLGEKGGPSAADLEFKGALEKQLGRKIGVKTGMYGRGLKKVYAQKESVKAEASRIKEEIDRDVRAKLDEVRQKGDVRMKEIDDLVQELGRKYHHTLGWVLGAGAAASIAGGTSFVRSLSNYIRRRAFFESGI